MGQNTDQNEMNNELNVSYNLKKRIDKELGEINEKKKIKNFNKLLKKKISNNFKRSCFNKKFNKNYQGINAISDLLNLIYDSNIDRLENYGSNRGICEEIFDVRDAFELIEPNNIEKNDIKPKTFSMATRNILLPQNNFGNEINLAFGEKIEIQKINLDSNYKKGEKNIKKEFFNESKDKKDICENNDLDLYIKKSLINHKINKLTNKNYISLTNQNEKNEEIQEKIIEKNKNNYKKPKDNANLFFNTNNYDKDNYKNEQIFFPNNILKDDLNINNITGKSKSKENTNENKIYFNTNKKKYLQQKNLIFNNFKTLNNKAKLNKNFQIDNYDLSKQQNTLNIRNNTQFDEIKNYNNNTNISKNNNNKYIIYNRKNINKKRAHSWDIEINRNLNINKNEIKKLDNNKLEQEPKIIFNTIRKGKNNNKLNIKNTQQLFKEKTPEQVKRTSHTKQNKINYENFKNDFPIIIKNDFNKERTSNIIGNNKGKYLTSDLKKKKNKINNKNGNKSKEKEKCKRFSGKPKKPPKLNIKIDLKELIREEKMEKILEEKKETHKKPKKAIEIFDYPEDLKYNVFGKQYKFTYDDKNFI